MSRQYSPPFSHCWNIIHPIGVNLYNCHLFIKLECLPVSAAKEGLYVMISLFLVLQCNSWQMLCQRFLRKVGRQLVLTYFVACILPPLVYTDSPMNCLKKPEYDLKIVARSATDFFFGGKEAWWKKVGLGTTQIYLVLLLGGTG